MVSQYRVSGVFDLSLLRLGVSGCLGLGLVACEWFCPGIPGAIAQSVIPDTGATTTTNTRVTQTGNQFDIDGGVRSPDNVNLFHSFQELGLTRDQIANFLVTPELENILTRVTSGNVSSIDGLLQVSGGDANLFLMNPAGILFGPNARLNVGADFMATTASGIGFDGSWFSAVGENNYASLTGDPGTFAFGRSGIITNSGLLTINSGHSLSLVGNTVINMGLLSAPEGRVVLQAVPENERLRLGSDGYSLSLVPEGDGWDENGPNLLPFSDLTLTQLLAIEGISEATGLTLNPDGTVALSHSETVIPSDAGVAIASGTLDTSGSQGGEVQVLGDRVGLVDATVDVSGLRGGGLALIGGDYQGNGTVPNAQLSYVGPNSSIVADSLNRGDGGRVIVWADGSTDFRGSISATGGARSGDGGFAEVSGKQNLGFLGTADLSASYGQIGNLLLDPENITIVSGTGAADDALLPNLPATGDYVISEAALEGIAGDTGIQLEATGNITIEDLADDRLDFARGSGAVSFNADADGDQVGNFTMELTDVIAAPSPISFTSAGANGRTVSFSGHNITLGTVNTRSGLDATTTSFSPGGNVDVSASGDIITATLDVYADSDPDILNLGNAGSITLRTTGGSIDTRAGGLSANAAGGNSGSIYLEAEGDINTARIDGIPVQGGGVSNGLTVLSRNGSINVSYTSSLPDTLDRAGLEGIIIGFDPTQLSQDGESAAIRLEAPNGSITLSTIRAGALQSGGEIILDSPTVIFSQPIDPITNQSVPGAVVPGFPSGGIFPSTVEVITITGDLDGSSGDRNVSLFIDEFTNDGVITVDGDLGSSNPFQSIIVTGSTFNLGGSLVAEENITLNAPVVITTTNPVEFSVGTGAIALNQGLNTGDVNLTLTADSLTLAENTVIEGNGTLTLQPSSLAQPIALGTDTDFGLTQAELNTLRDFSSVTIGRTDGTGGIAIANALNFSSLPTTLEPGEGAIALNNNITSASDLTLGTTILGSDITITTTSGNGNVTFNGPVDSETDNAFSLDISAGSGTITFDNAIGNTTPLNDLKLNNSETLTLPNTIAIEGTLTQTDAASVSLGGTLASSQGDISFSSPIQITEATTITATNGRISLTNDITATGSVELNANTSIETGAIAATDDIDITTSNGPLTTGNLTSNGSNISLSAANGITAGPTIDSDGGNVRFRGTVTADNLTINADTGNINFQEKVTLNTLDINTSGRLTIADGLELEGALVSPDAQRIQLGGAIDVGQGDVEVRSPITLITPTTITAENGAIALTRPVNSNGGANSFSLEADQGEITTGDIASSGGNVAFNASADITTGEIVTEGGSIALIANGNQTIVTTDNLTSSNGVGGGDITVVAGLQITTGDIDSSADTGDGGDVSLDPSGDVEVGFINTESDNAAGGNIVIETGSFFRSTNTFNSNPTEVNNPNSSVEASLSALGETQGGNITITHAGGDLLTFFNIDDLNQNGTAGAIVTGNAAAPANIIPSGEAYLGPYEQIRAPGVGDIQLITAPVPTPDKLDENEQEDPSLPDDPSRDFGLEHYFTGLYEDYFNHSGTRIKSLAEIQETLQNIEDQTGVRSAVLYAFFAPKKHFEIWGDKVEYIHPERPCFDQYGDGDRVASTSPPSPSQALSPTTTNESEFFVDVCRQDITNPDITNPDIEQSFEYHAHIEQEMAFLQETFGLSSEEVWAYYQELRESDPLDAILGLVLVTAAKDVSVYVEDQPENILNRRAAAGAVQQFRDELFKQEQQGRNSGAYKDDAEEFYDWLLPGDIDEVVTNQGIEHLTFVLDHELRGVPIAALRDGEKFIIDDLSVNIMPSVSLTETDYRPFTPERLLAMGTSDFSDHDPPLTELRAVKFELANLEEMEDEQWGNVLLFPDDIFTTDNLRDKHRDEAPEAIHLATHARFTRGEADESYLYFANGDRVSLEDIRDWDLSDPIVNLMLLSACNTAMGNENAELGFAGVAYQSQITSVLGSLWTVEDTATSILMTAFHHTLAQRNPPSAHNLPNHETGEDVMTKAEALRTVQRALQSGQITIERQEDRESQDVRYSLNMNLGESEPISIPQDLHLDLDELDLGAPIHWSSFVVVGNPW